MCAMFAYPWCKVKTEEGRNPNFRTVFLRNQSEKSFRIVPTKGLVKSKNPVSQALTRYKTNR